MKFFGGRGRLVMNSMNHGKLLNKSPRSSHSYEWLIFPCSYKLYQPACFMQENRYPFLRLAQCMRCRGGNRSLKWTFWRKMPPPPTDLHYPEGLLWGSSNKFASTPAVLCALFLKSPLRKLAAVLENGEHLQCSLELQGDICSHICLSAFQGKCSGVKMLAFLKM